MATKKYTALIVDDDSKIRGIHKKYFSRNGFEVKMVENGQEAVNLFLAGNQFDLVIMDMDMPVMDGPQATKELRALGVESLIIGMSSSTSDTKIEAFIHAGLDEYYTKPMNMAKIAAIVARLK